MNEIVMPKLSDTMTEGRVVSWKKRVGEAVNRGDVLAEVETDKANMELEAFVSGVLLEIKVQAGELAQVGTVIATIGKAEEQGAGTPQQSAPVPEVEPEATKQEEARAAMPAAAPAEPQPEAAQAEQGAPVEERVPAPSLEKPAQGVQVVPLNGEKQAPAAPPKPGVDETQPVSQPGEPQGPQAVQTGQPQPARPAEPGPAEAGGGGERAAPVVRRRARELGIDLSQVQGSGPEGRILMQDLEQQGKAPAQPTQPAPQGVRLELVKDGPIPRLRAAVAKTVAESWHNIPHFTVTMDIIMDEAEAIRRQLKQSGMPVSVNDMIVKGVSLALLKYPQLNASFHADAIQVHKEINISIAVGMPDGVLMPVLAGCQHRSLLEISQEGHRLVERARSGALSEQEMSGGTFSVSNLGMFHVASFSAIIHPSQAAVLAVGAVIDAPLVRTGVLSSAKMMKVTLSADHRVVDGAYAAQFLVEFKEVLENPVRLLL